MTVEAAVSLHEVALSGRQVRYQAVVVVKQSGLIVLEGSLEGYGSPDSTLEDLRSHAVQRFRHVLESAARSLPPTDPAGEGEPSGPA